MIVLLLSFTSCATMPNQYASTAAPTTIGPYSDFSGRLIVLEPKRRWQVLLEWHAATAEKGRVRLTHAATATVIELQWRHEQIWLRDSNHPDWQVVEQQKLAEMGIVLPPRQLAAILLGNMPASFKQKSNDTWESREVGHSIRLRWQASSKKLSLTDISHGRQATLIIQ